MAISTIGTDALASAAVTSAKLASGAPSRSQLPAGTVLQVVNATYGTQTSTTGSSYTSSGIAASITPTSASSKILVVVSAPLSLQQLSAADFAIGVAIYRNASAVYTETNTYDTYYIGPYANYIGNARQRTSVQYLDSPATTSATTYTLYFAAYQGTAFTCRNGAIGNITLMEIAA